MASAPFLHFCKAHSAGTSAVGRLTWEQGRRQEQRQLPRGGSVAEPCGAGGGKPEDRLLERPQAGREWQGSRSSEGHRPSELRGAQAKWKLQEARV